MKTSDPFNDKSLTRAVAILRGGGLVAFPTETVYGLGADATNADAVAKIFAAKGRPASNPLIAHVADIAAARSWTPGWTDTAQTLATAFWPGPLTLVLPRHPDICETVAAGGESVGLRVPAHPVALALLAAFGKPVAAPSANRANRVSPTTAEHVRDELGDRVDLILDGGPCNVGIESTVLDLTTDPPRILRPGGVSAEQLREFTELSENPSSKKQASPGQGAIHYAPRTPAFRFTDPIDIASRITEHSAVVLIERLDPDEYARNLYAMLRRLDIGRHDAIFIQMPPADPAWEAVRDRLQRATRVLPIV